MNLLKICKIDIKYYTSKEYYNPDEMEYSIYRINKFIISDEDELCMIKDICVKEILFNSDCNFPVQCITRNITEPTSNNLPKSLTRLTFGMGFNQSVDYLPNKIIHLELGCYFNQPVDNLPKYLKSLKFGDDFNQPVNKLPKDLTHLTFGHNFNQTIDELPIGITHLELGDCFGRKTDLSQYAKLKLILINNICQLELFSNIPRNAKIINSSTLKHNNK